MRNVFLIFFWNKTLFLRFDLLLDRIFFKKIDDKDDHEIRFEDVIDFSIFLFFISFLYHWLADQRRYTYVVMYTSECRTITNVNTVERGRYRGRLFTVIAIVIKIGVQNI